jgi:hypothetical protein
MMTCGKCAGLNNWFGDARQLRQRCGKRRDRTTTGSQGGVGCPVRLDLQSRVVGQETAGVGVTRLLNDMRQFVGKESAPVGRMRAVLSSSEDDMVPDRVGVHFHPSSFADGTRLQQFEPDFSFLRHDCPGKWDDGQRTKDEG